ncbi:TaqI-like C-terminal specificity domain-containing protein [Helicobacter trogontum]|uniref:TaqI-like C-terminal specificity domain-containing protein n=1 Tax=Helicobacter trogontum TaxID=50960 RepID=A0A4U8SF73_9HELI|nr:TaqI-like C-terminal specificity domain-containing protein [Helicobacter trogontum]TLD84870.1 hypothetical protein LS81_000400 [Helicobacter trogontum]
MNLYFVQDNQGMLINQTCYFILSDNRYLCAVLDSKMTYFYMKQIVPNLGDKTFRQIKQYIEKLPIPKIDSTNKALSDEIISLVEQILDSKAKDPTKDTKELESKIDNLVYYCII